MGQYFSNEDLKSNIQKFNVDILGNRYSFYTDNGVFSKEGGTVDLKGGNFF